MEFMGEVRVQAVIDSFHIISSFLYGLAQRLNLTEDTLFDLDLAVEEASVNVIQYAYPGRPPGEMVLSVSLEGELLHLTLVDWGIPFDPSKIKPYDIYAPIEERVRGGMGLHLIHSVMDVVEWDSAGPAGGVNRLRLVKRIQRMKPGMRRPSKGRELSAISAVSQVMATSIDLDNLLRLIIDKLVETLDVERATLFLVDEERQELFSRVLMENSGVSEIRLKIGEGLAGHVAATGQRLNIPDASQDPRHLRDFDLLTGFYTRSILSVPMYNPQGKIIGVVQLLNKRTGMFTTRDERLLTVMATQAAISIENARLYEREMKQRLINQELNTARNIQTSFLPQTIPQVDGWDIAAFWRPMLSVAGDFYDFYLLPDGRLAVLIADVSGKGVPAALFMALSVTVLRFAMGLGFSPCELLYRANDSILADQRSKMFATTFVAYLDAASGFVQFASAGHNPPLLYRADPYMNSLDKRNCKNLACEYLEASGVALGIFEEVGFEEKYRQMKTGDVLVLYTDGITEILDANGDEFGEERLERLLTESAPCTAEEIKDRIMRAVSVFSQDGTPYDDETLVVVKRVAGSM
jgi:sigma-B regulation protein RsbU (phosphoserine phosphatase)